MNHFFSDKGLKNAVVNRTGHCRTEESLEITFTVPLIDVFL